MSIPKKIHYVWGYQEPKPKLTLACTASWKAAMPEYEIIEWNEQKIDYDQLAQECPFFSEARKIKLWAYISDYIRLKALYLEGGVYLDTDVQILKSIDNILSSKGGTRFFAGFHPGFYRGKSTSEFVEGAVMGSVHGHPFLKDMIEFYQKDMLSEDIPFQPYALNRILTKNYGLPDKPKNEITHLSEGITLYPTDYFHPSVVDAEKKIDFLKLNSRTYTIHWNQNSYRNSWRNHRFMNLRSFPWWKTVGIFAFYLAKKPIKILLSLIRSDRGS